MSQSISTLPSQNSLLTYISPSQYSSIKDSYHITNYKWINSYQFLKNLKSGDIVKYHRMNNTTVISFICLSKTIDLTILKLKIYVFFEQLADFDDQNEKHIKKMDEFINNDLSNMRYVPFELLIVENNKIVTILDNNKNTIPIHLDKNIDTYLVSLPPYKTLHLKLTDIIDAMLTKIKN